MGLTALIITLTRFWEDCSVLLDYESMLEGDSTLRHLPETHVQPFCPRWIWTPGHFIEREMERSIWITRPTRDIVYDGEYDEDSNVQCQHRLNASEVTARDAAAPHCCVNDQLFVIECYDRIAAVRLPSVIHTCPSGIRPRPNRSLCGTTHASSFYDFLTRFEFVCEWWSSPTTLTSMNS
jgi:hypothetical protein